MSSITAAGCVSNKAILPDGPTWSGHAILCGDAAEEAKRLLASLRS